MAHLANSQIQAHSAGSTFPYVIFRQETDGIAQWGIICPSGAELFPFHIYDAALAYLERHHLIRDKS